MPPSEQGPVKPPSRPAVTESLRTSIVARLRRNLVAQFLGAVAGCGLFVAIGWYIAQQRSEPSCVTGVEAGQLLAEHEPLAVPTAAPDGTPVVIRTQVVFCVDAWAYGTASAEDTTQAIVGDLVQLVFHRVEGEWRLEHVGADCPGNAAPEWPERIRAAVGCSPPPP